MTTKKYIYILYFFLTFFFYRYKISWVHRNQKWQPPPEDIYKVNVDHTFAGIGIVVRDSHGMFMAGRSMVVAACSDFQGKALFLHGMQVSDILFSKETPTTFMIALKEQMMICLITDPY